MTQIPQKILQRRAELAARYLSGQGIEIGALDCPLTLPATARVRGMRSSIETGRFGRADGRARAAITAVETTATTVRLTGMALY